MIEKLVELRPTNFIDQIKVNGEEMDGITFCQEIGLLPKLINYSCVKKCGGLMKPERAKKTKLGHIFRCKKCRCGVSWTHNTWFQGKKISIIDCLILIFYWCFNFSVKQVSTLTSLSENTIVGYFDSIRKVCVDDVVNSGQKLGGVGETVEIDETHLYTRKYHKGRVLALEKEQIWFVGGIERRTKKVFVVLTKKRDKNKLNQIIEQWVEKGTTIYTDGWRGYNDLFHLGYDHSSVNHKKIGLIQCEKTCIHNQWKIFGN